MGQAEHPHGAPPGQSGETPAHGAPPPGQVDKPDKPDEETDEDLEPTHPIVDPDAPYVEHHEGDEPDKAPA
jgi:hypothetical protein